MSDEKKEAYWLIIIGESVEQGPQCIRCDDEDQFAQAVEQHILSAEDGLYAFAFHGTRIALGAPQPVASFRLGDKDIQVGQATFQFDESGRFTPLKRVDDK